MDITLLMGMPYLCLPVNSPVGTSRSRSANLDAQQVPLASNLFDSKHTTTTKAMNASTQHHMKPSLQQQPPQPSIPWLGDEHSGRADIVESQQCELSPLSRRHAQLLTPSCSTPVQPYTAALPQHPPMHALAAGSHSPPGHVTLWPTTQFVSLHSAAQPIRSKCRH
jgi:hypothetical protein